MDQILLCSNHIPLVTSINNTFIQKYMLNANGSYVKVYLYLSMCIQSGQENLSISSLADQMENTEKDILRALRYWEKKGLMILQRDEDRNIITGIEIINPDTLATEPSEKVAPKPQTAITSEVAVTSEAGTQAIPVKQPDKTTKKDFSVTEEQTTRLAQDDNFSWTCLIVESYLERPLKTGEVQLLTYLYDTMHFSKELILYLYEYCCSLKKTSIKYVQAVALSWADHNITTPEEAQHFSDNYSTSHTAISKALALGRPLAGIECQYVERWMNQWKMDLAVILEACNRTMLAIQKADFKYLDGILSKWHESDVHTLQDVQVCDENYKIKKKENKLHGTSKKEPTSSVKRNQFQSFQQRSSSQDEIDQLEKILLTQ